MKIKPLAASMAALAALTMVGSMPASAQTWMGQNGYDREAFWRDAPRDPYQRIAFLQRRIDRSSADGTLSPRDARRARYDLSRISRTADHMRYRNGGQLPQSGYDYIQTQLDQLSQRIRWQRQTAGGGYNGGGYNGGSYNGGSYNGGSYNGGGYDRSGDGDRRYATDYDASRYYREGPNYQERRLTASDEVYRGSDGRYYCKRNDGTTGLVVGAAAGGILGNVIDGGHNRVAGTLIGGALGALAGKSIDQNSDVRCR